MLQKLLAMSQSRSSKLFPRSNALESELRCLHFAASQDELAALPTEAYQRVKAAIFKLSENPRPSGCRKLSGREGWRIRIGSYRVIYELNDAEKKVFVLHIGHRRDVYRN
jgi:mRNA interferase RelE/StbE